MDRSTRALVAMAYLVTLANNAFIIAPAPLRATLHTDLGISYAQVGGLVSVCLLFLLLVQLPSGLVIDRFDNRRLIVMATLALAVSAVPTVLFPRYEVLLAQRAVAGALTAFIFVPLGNLVSRAAAPHSARAIGLFLAGPPSGMAVGLFATPALAPALTWPVAQALFAFVLPILALVLWGVARPLDLRGSRFNTGEFLRLFRRGELWLVGLAFACTYSGYIFYVSWTSAYLGDHGLDLVLAGIVGALIPATGILARPLGGWSAAGPFQADLRVPLVLGFLGVAVMTMAVMVLPAPTAVYLLPLAGFLAQFPFSVYYVLALRIVPGAFSGSALAFLNATSLIGGTVTPVAAGYLRDATGDFGAAFQMLLGISVLGAIGVLGLRRR